MAFTLLKLSLQILMFFRIVWLTTCTKDCFCYTFNTQRLFWTESRYECRKGGGDLVTMETERKWEFINAKIQRINNYPHEWHIGLKKRREWKWVNDQILTINKWQIDEKKGIKEPDGNGDCVAMSKNYPPGTQGLFKDVTCYYSLMYICEYSKGNPRCKYGYYPPRCNETNSGSTTAEFTKTTNTTTPLSTKKQTTKSTSDCFCYTFNTQRFGWTDSRDECRKGGGDLVTMETKEKWQFINSKIQGIDVEPNEWYIGLKKNIEEWKWVDDQILTINKWQRDETQSIKEPDGDGDCVVMAKDYPPGTQGLFKDVTCSYSVMYICEYRKGNPRCKNGYYPPRCNETNLGSIPAKPTRLGSTPAEPTKNPIVTTHTSTYDKKQITKHSSKQFLSVLFVLLGCLIPTTF